METKETRYPLSDLEEIVLSVLSKGRELYGLQISKTIEAGSDGKLQVGFGSLYPALRRMEAKKFVTSHWDDTSADERGGARRRYYQITATGVEALAEKKSIRAGIDNYKPVLA